MQYKISIFILIFTSLFFSSCSDEWNEHYGNQEEIKSELNLYQYIKSQSDLSKFTQMVEIAGFDSIFSQFQTYTVWAPVNSALEDVNLSDTLLVTNLVKNHVSRFSVPTSDIQYKTIFMMSSKFLVFKIENGAYLFGDQPLLSSNIIAQNGIVHKLNGKVPYLSNLWEFIGQAAGLDSLKAYLYAQSTSIFDQLHSIEIGTNENNQAIYDSVIIFSNPILDRIGQMQLEDSLYVAILPNNQAWTKIYNQIKSKYKTLPKDGGAAQQRLNTQWAIVENLVFNMKNKTDEPTAADSLVSTTGSKYKPVSYLFEGSEKHFLSNGLAYVTDSLKYKPNESWQKAIRIEAENADFGRSYLYSTLYIRSGLGSKFNVSGSKYLVSEPTTLSKSTPNSVTIPVPNTLSGKYRVYCVLLPPAIVSETDKRANKVKFAVSYMGADGVQVNDAVVTSTNLLSTKPGAIGAVFTSAADTISKMFVTQIELPYCNIYTPKSSVSDITFKVKVENAALITETVKFDRNLRLDYVVMEPVIE